MAAHYFPDISQFIANIFSVIVSLGGHDQDNIILLVRLQSALSEICMGQPNTSLPYGLPRPRLDFPAGEALRLRAAKNSAVG